MFIFVVCDRDIDELCRRLKESSNEGPKTMSLGGDENSASFIEQKIMQAMITQNKPKKANINVTHMIFTCIVIIVLFFRPVIFCIQMIWLIIVYNDILCLHS